MEAVRALLAENRNTVLALTETWLYPDYPQQLLEVEGFICHRKDRPKNLRGGGVIVYIPEYLPSEALEDPADFESLCVKFRVGDKNIFIPIL